MSASPTPSLSQFLHSKGFEAHLSSHSPQVARTQEGLYSLYALPGSKIHHGSYWRGDRLQISPGWQLPEFPDGWFYRIQAEDTTGEAALLYHLKNNQIPYHPTPSIQPKQTLFLELNQSEAELQEGMKPKTRYNIKVAEKNGVRVEFFENNLLEQFPRFMKLLNQTGTRHGLRQHPESHYRSILEHLEPEQAVQLVFACKENQDLATAMLLTCGKVGTYLHGGSNYQERAQMAPHLMHWQIISKLKAEGMEYYDFWGINATPSVPVDNSFPQPANQYKPIPGHSSEGTTRFKLGFGGKVINYPATLDVIKNPFWYSLYMATKRFQSQKSRFNA